MWTIGFINNIENNIIYLTYTHVDYNIPFTLVDVRQFKIKDIVGIELNENIIHGIAHYKVETICKYSQSTIADKIHIFYEYQKYLISIANCRFDTDEFYKQLKELGISKLLYYHLSSILSSNWEFLHKYIENVDIVKLIASRKVSIIEYEYDKNGDYSYRCHIDCTNYQDSFLNSFLHIIGSYSNTCVNNTPVQLPNETYSQAVDRVIKETANRTLIQYSKEKHFQHLLSECKQIRSLYEDEKKAILNLAKKYLYY